MPGLVPGIHVFCDALGHVEDAKALRATYEIDGEPK